MKNTLLVLLLTAYALALPAQDSFSTIEERMTGKEFSAAGLDKLSDDELGALNDWLRSHSVAALENATGPYTDVRGFELKAVKGMDDSTIVSRIMGTFVGWRGGDFIFKLENGMIWKQVESGNFSIPPVETPVVTIEPGLFNSWRLSVEGYNRTVKVERIQ